VPVSLPNTTVADSYPSAGGGGAQISGRDIFASGWFTVANAAVLAEYLYGLQGFDIASPEMFLAPGTYPLAGNEQNPLNGIRFRNAVAGSPAQVWGAFFYKTDPVLSSSAEFTSQISPSGSVSTGVLGPTPSLTLPANPADSQLTILTDSLATPSYFWLLQWNAASNQWRFIGGDSLISEVMGAGGYGAGDTVNSTVYVDAATVGPSITIPQKGTYEALFGFQVNKNVTDVGSLAAIKFGAAGASDNDATVAVANFNGSPATPNGYSASRKLTHSASAIGEIWKIQYRGTSANDMHLYARYLSVTPKFITP